MTIEYYVDCFDETLLITIPEEYEHKVEEITNLLDKFCQEWHNAEEIKDDITREMVMDSDLYDYMMGRLSEVYNKWEDWEVKNEIHN